MKRNALGRGLGALIREPEELVGSKQPVSNEATAPNAAEDVAPGQVLGERASAEEVSAVRESAERNSVEAIAEGAVADREAGKVSAESGGTVGTGASGVGVGAAVAARKIPTIELERPLPRSVSATTARPSVDAGGGIGQGGNYSGVLFIDLELIHPSRFQPRKTFSEEALNELARSITNSGVIQPIAVRKIGNHYELIAGERRWRAAQRAELRKIPAIVHDVADEVALEFTLIENLQREDLNPMEEAHAYERLIQEFGLTHDEVASRTGKDRTTIANALRLMGLEKGLQQMMEDGTLTAGAGRALLGVSDSGFRRRMASRYARGALTVRQIEKLAARQARRERGAHETKSPVAAAAQDPNIQRALEELQRTWGTKVVLVPPVGRKAGQLIFEYYDQRQLMGLWDRLSSKQ